MLTPEREAESRREQRGEFPIPDVDDLLSALDAERAQSAALAAIVRSVHRPAEEPGRTAGECRECGKLSPCAAARLAGVTE